MKLRNWILTIFLVLVIAVCFHSLYADMETDLQFIVKSNPIIDYNSAKKFSIGLDLQETSEMKLFLLGSIRLYQLFISTQDLSVCNFTPSCSHFAQEAIRRYGFIRGVLMTSDRLQRCNSMSIYYAWDERTGKYKDPVENYCMKKSKNQRTEEYFK